MLMALSATKYNVLLPISRDPLHSLDGDTFIQLNVNLQLSKGM